MSGSYSEVKFKSSRDHCAAWLYQPANDKLKTEKGTPIIVMANGFGLTNKDSLSGFADRFQAAGFMVLAFEYRFLGESGGKPRQLISNSKQLHDWDKAISYAKSLEGADTDKLILWGCSYTGGHVVITTSRHPEVFASVALVGVMRGLTETLDILKKSGQGLKLVGAGLRDAVYGVFRKSKPIPIVGKSGVLAVETAPGAYEGYKKITDPDWINLFCPRFVLTGFLYSPISHASKIKCPTLIQIADNDLESSPKDQRNTVKKIAQGSSKSYECGHFDVFCGDFQEKTAKDGIDYLLGLL